jgi:rubrerythrin
MNRAFTADEVLKLAVELEETGQVFYEVLAVSAADQRVAGLCRRLGLAERSHLEHFTKMRRELTGRSDLPAAAEQAFAQERINSRIVPKPREARRLAAGGALPDMLELALQMEHNSVRFYTDMLALVPSPDQEIVRKIIAEENDHVAELELAQKDLR